jgi:hypothetical protein
MIDLRSFVACFHKVKWTELAITHEISRVLGKNIISCSTVGKYVRAFVLSTKETNTAIVLELETDFSLDARISLVLSEEPFLSVCQIAKKVTLSKSRMYYHLTHTIKWKLRHFQWVPHSLTDSGKCTGWKEPQNFWNFHSQSITKGDNNLSPLTSHGFIGRSIGSSSGFQRIMNREQEQGEGSLTTK